MKTIIKIIPLLIVAMLFSNCTEDNMDLNFGGPTFNLDLFEQNIIDYVNAGSADPVGWGYVISQDGNFARGNDYGLARTTEDGKVDFSITKDVNTASVTKFFTAIAVMQLLEVRNMNINSKIFPFLPPGFDTNDGVDDLTFRHLLTHTSGLESVNADFDATLSWTGLRNAIAGGVVNPQTRQYLNANFALFRIIIPALWKDLPGAPAIGDIDDEVSQDIYLQYMRENVFAPAGVFEAGCLPENREEATLYYASGDENTSNGGLYYDDWEPICGGGGYFLTPMEVASVLAYYQHTETLLSNDSKEVMKDNRIGMDLEDGDGREIHGSYYGKNGSISNSGQGVQAEITMFPNGIEVVFMANSQGQTYQNGANFVEMIYDAYNDAWN